MAEEIERWSDERKKEIKKALEQAEEKWARSNIESKARCHDIRRMTLDEWAYQENRNDSVHGGVHGGSLRSDLEVISSFTSDSDLNRERVARWKDAFEKSYGLSYDFLRQNVTNIPDKVLLACNRRASVLHVTDWKNHQNNIKKNADTIIEEWLLNPNDPDLFKEGSTAQTLITEIEKEWVQVPLSDECYLAYAY